jgi:hypothetical protein
MMFGIITPMHRAFEKETIYKKKQNQWQTMPYKQLCNVGKVGVKHFF